MEGDSDSSSEEERKKQSSSDESDEKPKKLKSKNKVSKAPNNKSNDDKKKSKIKKSGHSDSDSDEETKTNENEENKNKIITKSNSKEKEKDKKNNNEKNEEEEEEDDEEDYEEEDEETDEEMEQVDAIIEKLLSVKGKKAGTYVPLTETEIKLLIRKCKEILQKQPAFLELGSPISIMGDIHGQYFDLLRLFDYGGYPPSSNYLFLGDYVDRGKQSIETICLLMSYKIKYPENFFMIRGNHEAELVNRLYGFYDECRRRYSIKLWKDFTVMFNWLPVSALIDDKIFCVHGGLSPDLKSIEQLYEIQRPTDVPNSGLLCDILWSDPSPDVDTWGENERGVSYVFSPNIIKQFLEENSLDLICRAHQVVEDGYEFFADRTLVTVFSAPDYCGEYGNCAAMMIVDHNLMCSFKVLKPLSEVDTPERELPNAGEERKL